MNKNPLLQTLIQMTGQRNVITVHRPFVDFTGSLEAAMMLSQLLYWTPRSSMDGWVAKSDKEWQDELCLSRYGSRNAANTLEKMEVIETTLKKFKGAPTKHYKVDWEILENKWVEWLELNNGLSEIRQSDYSELDNGLSENEQSLTETTTEITKEKIYDRKKGIEEAKQRKAEQRAKRGDIVDLLVSASPALQEQEAMRQRVENALHRNLDWDSARSPWNGYEKKLVSREKENGQTIEGFMEWFNADEFRRKGVIYLNPTKIEDWWQHAFEESAQDDYHTRQVNRMERL